MNDPLSRSCNMSFHDECQSSMRDCKCECHFEQASFNDVLESIGSVFRLVEDLPRTASTAELADADYFDVTQGADSYHPEDLQGWPS